MSNLLERLLANYGEPEFFMLVPKIEFFSIRRILDIRLSIIGNCARALLPAKLV